MGVLKDSLAGVAGQRVASRARASTRDGGRRHISIDNLRAVHVCETGLQGADARHSKRAAD
jgi:hypothetical protein